MRCKNCLTEMKGNVCPKCGMTYPAGTEKSESFDELEESLWESLEPKVEKQPAAEETLEDPALSEAAEDDMVPDEVDSESSDSDDEIEVGITEKLNKTDRIEREELARKREKRKQERQSKRREADEQSRLLNFEAIVFIVICVILVLGCYSAYHFDDNRVTIRISEDGVMEVQQGRKDAVRIAEGVSEVLASDVTDGRYLYRNVSGELVLQDQTRTMTITQVSTYHVEANPTLDLVAYEVYDREKLCFELYVWQPNAEEEQIEYDVNYIGYLQFDPDGNGLAYSVEDLSGLDMVKYFRPGTDAEPTVAGTGDCKLVIDSVDADGTIQFHEQTAESGENSGS